MFDAPIADSMGIITVCVILYAMRSKPQLAMALFLSMVSAKYLTYLHLQEKIDFVSLGGWQALVMGFCSLLCITGFDNGRIKVLDIRDSGANFAVGALYAVREILIAAMLVGILSLENMWLSSMVFLLLQILIVAGSTHYGNSSSNHIRFNYLSSRLYYLILQKIRIDGKTHDR